MLKVTEHLEQHPMSPDAHFQTLRATRIRKIPDAASAAVAAAAVPDRTKQRAENSAMVRRWASQHKGMASVSDVLPLSQTGQATWITACPSELEALVRALPLPVLYLSGMPGHTLINFGHAINSEAQLLVIRQHAGHVNEKFRELCTGWAETAAGQRGKIRWKTTDSIQRWRRVVKLQPELICATVVKSLSDIDHWGILNVLCILLPHLAPVDGTTTVVIPQTKASVYRTSDEVRNSVASILCKPPNWQPAIDLISQECRQ
uniref:Uncharacterized protein n=1 Tax=Hyaloperonospora arabidopsidis (strain Emoy2) TaxID=559515 RepID=M4BLI1_HYAAE